jgi:hypothetical protein
LRSGDAVLFWSKALRRIDERYATCMKFLEARDKKSLSTKTWPSKTSTVRVGFQNVTPPRMNSATAATFGAT